MKTANQWDDEAGCGVPHRNFIREVQQNAIYAFVDMISWHCDCAALAQDGDRCEIHKKLMRILHDIDEGAKP